MKLFAVSLSAVRDDPSQDRLELSYSTICILFEPDTGDFDTPESGAKEACLEVFPIEKGWRDHREFLYEIRDGLTFSPKGRPNERMVLSWSVEKKRLEEIGAVG